MTFHSENHMVPVPKAYWGIKIAQRSGLKKAKIAVARKLSVIMHRMWRDDAPFRRGAA